MSYIYHDATFEKYAKRGMASKEEADIAYSSGIPAYEVGRYYSAGVEDVQEMVRLNSIGVDGTLIRLFERLGFPQERLHEVSWCADAHLVQFLLDRGARDLDDIAHALRSGVRLGSARILFSCGAHQFDQLVRIARSGIDAKVVSFFVESRSWRWNGSEPDLAAMTAEPPVVRVRSNGSLLPLTLADGFRLTSPDPDAYAAHLSADALGGDGRLTRVERCWRESLGTRWNNRSDLPKGLGEHVDNARRALIASAWLGNGAGWEDYAIGEPM